MKDKLIDLINRSLENMNKKFTDLSKLRFDEISQSLKERLQKQKVLERPFAYEFYHQFRKLWDSGSVREIIGKNIVIQAEVDKRYQQIPNLKRMPDFLLHQPSTKTNLAVIEVKLASNSRQIKDDFDKLIAFKKRLNYKHLIEVIIGQKKELETAEELIRGLNSDGEMISIITFNITSWQANQFNIKYAGNQKPSRLRFRL